MFSIGKTFQEIQRMHRILLERYEHLNNEQAKSNGQVIKEINNFVTEAGHALLFIGVDLKKADEVQTNLLGKRKEHIKEWIDYWNAKKG